MKKVLYIVSTLRETGPTNQLFGIISNLNKNDYNPVILTLSPEPENSRIKDFVDNGIEVNSLELSRITTFLKGKSEVKEIIKKINPDIIHTSGMRADSIVSSIPGVNSRHCMTVRNYVYDDLTAKFGNTIGYIAAKKSMTSMNKCNYVVCCSKSLEKKYSKHFDKDLFVIQNGVKTSENKPVPSLTKKTEIRQKLGIDDDNTIYLVVGSLIKRKDPETIIKGFLKSKVSQVNSQLLFLGSGTLEAELRKYASNEIKFFGNVKNVKEFLQAADYYVSASKSEGLPNSVLEASSAGLEMILSKIPEHEEIFNNSKYNPEYFEIGDSEKLSKILSSKSTQSPGLPNYELSVFIDDNFSNKIMANEYQNFYEKMILKNQ